MKCSSPNKSIPNKSIPNKSITASTLMFWGLVLCGPVLFGIPQFTSVYAGPLALSDAPLFLSAGSVNPNVMLLIDDSKSMRNVIWDSGFDSENDYPDWSGSSWDQVKGNINYSKLADCDDAEKESKSGIWKRGINGSGDVKCLKLPRSSDPYLGGYTQYLGNYLNYLFDSYAHLTDLTIAGSIPQDYRMKVARDVATEIVVSTSGMRFGLTHFGSSRGSGEGGTIEAACGAGQSVVTGAIADLVPTKFTPLAEAYYEVTRYFRGMSGYFNSATDYTSPIQYRCQKNFVIVITDGLPYGDSSFPGNDPADIANTDASLPDWDGIVTSTSQSTYPNFPQYSDGYNPGGNGEGASLYLDDLAKFGYDIDLLTSGTDGDGESYDAPDYPKQNLNTYTIGFSLNNQMLEDAAVYGKGKYYTASDAVSLTSALRSALTAIQGQKSAAAAVALNSGSIQTDSLLYQARFDSNDWSGELRYIAIQADGSVGETRVEAQDILDLQSADSRVIISYRPDKAQGIKFRSDQLSVEQKAALFTGAPTTPDTEKVAYLENLIDYLRGERGNEQQNGGDLRNRTGKLGDIIHSGPAYVGAPRMRYDFDGYADWSDAAAQKARTPVVYVGANDGMLHGFDAVTGVELIAYVPATVYGNLYRLAQPDYNSNHRYFVDGAAISGDAYFNGAWHTVLAGGLRGGGRGFFALDVTDPNDFGENMANALVLWEFSDVDDADLGYSFSSPSIVRMADADGKTRWAVVFGNGYNSTGSGKAVLFILFLDADLSDGWTLGEDYLKISTEVGNPGNPNGLATPAAIDVDGDFIVDYIYAGDLLGKVWRFDVYDSDAANWGVGHDGSPLFEAKIGSKPQPITTRPMVGLNPDPYNNAGFMVYFGTGKYIESTDNSAADQVTQSIYGIWDNYNTGCVSDPGISCNNSTSGDNILKRDNLLAQQILAETTEENGSYRLISDNAIDWSSQRGWYLDLIGPDDGLNKGERVVTDVLLRNGNLIVSTMIPGSTQVCGFGGSGWLMVLDAGNGGRLEQSAFDVNSDGVFNDDDLIAYGSPGSDPVAASGLLIADGMPSAPTAAYVSSVSDNEYYGGGTDTETDDDDSEEGESDTEGATRSHDRIYINTGGGVINAPALQDSIPLGRLYWRQIK